MSRILSVCLCMMILGSGLCANAQDHYEQTAPLPPNTPSPDVNQTPDDYIQQASAFSKIGDYAKAVAVLTKGIERQPATSVLFLHRGRAYFQIAAAEKRIILCTKELAENPTAAASFLHRGFSYYNTGDYAKSIYDYTQAISNHPEYAAAYLGRSLAYIASGKIKEGMADYDHAVSLCPDLRPKHQQSLYLTELKCKPEMGTGFKQ